MGIGDWGLGIGDWGLGIGANAHLNSIMCLKYEVNFGFKYLNLFLFLINKYILKTVSFKYINNFIYII